VTRLEKTLLHLDADLRALGCRWALVGGWAVSVRAEPRPTRDIDVAIVVSSDSEAERVALALRLRGYRDNPDGALLEQTDVGRLATIRLLAPGEPAGGTGVDLLFASSGVEPEIVAAAQPIEILPGVVLPVVRAGHLLALKVLAGRPRDLEDVRSLIRHMPIGDLQEARETLDLISRRGFDRGKNLQVELARWDTRA
jgi:hypothetical protein